MSTYTAIPDADARQAAITRLRKKRGLQAHALAYLMVNLFLIAVWAVSDFGGFFWPMFLLFGWGIGLAFHIWDVYSPALPSEGQIEREMRHLTHQ
jgi:hypothetical protein